MQCRDVKHLAVPQSSAFCRRTVAMEQSSIAQKQTAAILRGPYGEHHSIETDWPVPQPGPREVLVRLGGAGICSGDVNPRDGYPPAPKEAVRPLVTGHEGVGRIVAMADEQDENLAFTIGARVGIGWRHWCCHECDQCRTGQDNLCQSQKVNGYDSHGTFQGLAARR